MRLAQMIAVMSGKPRSTLLNNLAAYYKLSDWTDSSGAGLTLTPAAGGAAPTIGAGGIIGNCADFEFDSAQYASRADDAVFSVGDIDFAFDCWVKPEVLGNNRCIFGKGTGVAVANQYQYMLYANAVGATYWSVSYSTDRVYVNTANGAMTAGAWNYVYVYHDSVNNVIGVSINGAAPTTKPDANGCFDGAGAFYLGTQPGAGASHWDGLIDEFAFWRGRILTPTEIAARYNGGVGNTHPFSSGSGPPFTAYYGTAAYISTID